MRSPEYGVPISRVKVPIPITVIAVVLVFALGVVFVRIEQLRSDLANLHRSASVAGLVVRHELDGSCVITMDQFNWSAWLDSAKGYDLPGASYDLQGDRKRSWFDLRGISDHARSDLPGIGWPITLDPPGRYSGDATKLEMRTGSGASAVQLTTGPRL